MLQYDQIFSLPCVCPRCERPLESGFKLRWPEKVCQQCQALMRHLSARSKAGEATSVEVRHFIERSQEYCVVLGEDVVRSRERLKMTQELAAYVMGWSQPRQWQIENATRSVIPIEKAQMLGIYYERTVRYRFPPFYRRLVPVGALQRALRIDRHKAQRILLGKATLQQAEFDAMLDAFRRWEISVVPL